MGASDVEDIYELSPLQQGMLLHSAHDGASDMYLSQQTYTVGGPLDTDILVRAWYAVVADHPALRVSFHWGGADKPLQVVHRAVTLPVHRHDWSDIPADLHGKWLERLYADDRALGMDLAAAPLQRLNIIRLGDDQHCLVWTYHHLLLDGWSVAVFMNDLLTHYRHLTGNGPPPVPGPPFRSYIAWLQRQDVAGAQPFWTELLSGVPRSRPIPLAPVDPRASTGVVDRRKVALPPPVVEALRRAAARHQVTVATLVQAAWSLVVHGLTGDRHVTFGCASAGRPADLPDADRIIGVFANTLPVHVEVPADGPLGPWLQDLQRTYARMRRYEHTPLADIKKWAGASGQALFQSLLSLENYPADVDTDDLAGGLAIRPAGLYDKVNIPVALSAVPEIGTLDLAVHRDRFPAGFVDDALRHLGDTLAALTTADDVSAVVGAAPTILLPTPEPSASAGSDVEAGTSPLERTIIDVFAEILELTEVDATSNFFDLGGDSFAAVRAISRIEGASVGLLAANPTPRELARAVADDLATADGVEPSSMLRAAADLVPMPRGAATVCTYQQEAAWFMHRLNPASTVLHVPFALRLYGDLDVEALSRSVCALVGRHEALRTRFVDEGGVPRQVIDPPPARMPLRPVRLTEAKVTRWATEHCHRPFDLSTGPVVRVALGRLTDGDHVLVMVLHHIVSDGWSVGVLGRELSELYAAEVARRPAELPELTLQPADFAAWQRRWLSGEELDRQIDFWRDSLAGLPTLEFPSDRPRPAQPTGAGSAVGRRLPPDLADATRAYARSRQVSLLAVFQAAVTTVLHRYTGQTDLALGSMFSGRTLPQIEPLVGYFGNVVVLRTDVGGRPTFDDLVTRCHRTILEATAHQDAPFRLVVDALQPERVTGRNPLFQVGLTLLPEGMGGGLTLGEVRGDIIGVPEPYSLYDISVDVADDGDGHLDVAVEYSTELFDVDRMARFVEHLTSALRCGLAGPDTVVDDLALVSAAEHEQSLGRSGYPLEPVHAMVAASVVRTPGALAVIDPGGETWSYQQVEDWSTQLAHRIRGHGVLRGDPVGVCFRPGADQLTALLAVWKAGGCQVVLDPDGPDGHAAATTLVVTTSEFAGRFPAALAVDTERALIDAEPFHDPGVEVTLDDVAAVFRSSGGVDVLVSHRTLAEQLTRLPDVYRVRRDDRVVHQAPYGSDGSLWGLFGPLVVGAAVAVPAAGVWQDVRALVRFVDRARATTLHVLPSTLQALLDARARPFGRLRRVCVHGERLPARTVLRLQHDWPGVDLHDVWSSAETAAVTATRCDSDDAKVPAGRALTGRDTYVLDDALRPVPVGVPGQLFVAGPGLALGYPGAPARTATTFVPDPFGDVPGRRMVATGDIVRRSADGGIEHLGRIDRIGVVRGRPVVAEQVEKVLAAHPAVRRCVVVPGDDGGLAAYVEAAAGAMRPEAVLRRQLAEQLPGHMVPDRVVVTARLPVRRDGRVDVTALPDPGRPRDAAGTAVTATQRWVVATVRELLGNPGARPADNLFELGANSLHATQFVAAARRLGVALEVRQVFAATSLEQLGEAVEAAAGLAARLRWRWWVRGRQPDARAVTAAI